ncbi:hypothetical protein F4808DRAFT_338915 [Astrocystis sublimbata]|nr:hypothetical protein F4808DRAFT_338915 [Astrocystis sublimbata]
MRYSILPALVALATALPGQHTENKVPTSTVTGYAHPVTFRPLDLLPSAAPTLSYANPPQPIHVGPPPDMDQKIVPEAPCTDEAPTPRSSLASSSPPPPSSTPHPLSLSDPVCTVIKGSYPTSTIPAFCKPSLFANSPSRAIPQSGSAVVTLKANSVPDKLSCCAECASYYNCFAWKFLPAYNETPSESLPAGFDPWRHGNCEIAYHTGAMEHEGEEGRTPSICPNGVVNGGISGASRPVARKADPWFDGLYYNGWNEGACSAELGRVIFRGGSDAGRGISLCNV